MRSSLGTYYEFSNRSIPAGKGNVRSRIELTEMVIISDCKNPETANNTAEIQNVNNYYSFGMPMHRRNYTSGAGAYRFGFNGKENDNEVKGDGNSLDFGARIYDSRLGRWLVLDPMQAAYPSLSSYTYALNTPIRAIDPDGELVIYVNGEVGEFKGQSSKGTHPDRASISYWGAIFVANTQAAFGEKFLNSKFVDGDLSVGASDRYCRGYYQAKKDFSDIMKGLKRDKNGKIIETIKVVSHSKGCASANGYIEGLRDMIEQNKDQFADPEGVIESHIMLAPHQSFAIKVLKSKTATVAVTHDGDWLSDDDVSGDVATIETPGLGWGNLSTYALGGHKVETFAKELVKLAKKLTDNNKEGKAKYDGVNGLLDGQKDYNPPTK